MNEQTNSSKQHNGQLLLTEVSDTVLLRLLGRLDSDTDLLLEPTHK